MRGKYIRINEDEAGWVLVIRYKINLVKKLKMYHRTKAVLRGCAKKGIKSERNYLLAGLMVVMESFCDVLQDLS